MIHIYDVEHAHDTLERMYYILRNLREKMEERVRERDVKVYKACKHGI